MESKTIKTGKVVGLKIESEALLYYEVGQAFNHNMECVRSILQQLHGHASLAVLRRGYVGGDRQRFHGDLGAGMSL